MLAKTFTVGNFKGGVGKTKITTMLAYDNAMINKKKTLVIDIDPQANASDALARTANLDHIDKTIVDGLNDGDLTTCITSILPNLDLIACNTQFTSFDKYVIEGFTDEKDRVSVLAKLIKPLKPLYETIYIDVPPTISVYSDNAMAASDYSIIAFQTVEESLSGVRKYVGYQNFMVEAYGINLQVIDILPCMLTADDKLDYEILDEARKDFGDAVSTTVINFQKRLKRYSRDGISLKRHKNGNIDQWDYKAHEKFIDILHEIESRDAYINSSVG